MDGVYDLDERYGREIWYESDGCHDSEDGFDSDDGYEGDDYDIDSRTIRRSGQMSWSFRGSVQFQIN